MPRSLSRKSAGYGIVIAGPGTTYARPSVSISATSMPSSEVPLISPIARRHGRPGEDGDSWVAAMLDDDTMSTPRSPFLVAATERGFIHQCTDLAALDARLIEASITAYVGDDCTADSLHVGRLVSIMLLRLCQRCGHKPIVL